METEYEQFRRVRGAAVRRDQLTICIAQSLRDEAEWPRWSAVRGAQVMAPAADAFLNAVAEVAARHPGVRDEGPAGLSLAQVVIPAGVAGLIGFGLAKAVFEMMSKLEEATDGDG